MGMRAESTNTIQVVASPGGCISRPCINRSDPNYQQAIRTIVTRLSVSPQRQLFQASCTNPGPTNPNCGLDCWLTATDEQAVCELLNVLHESGQEPDVDPIRYANLLSGGKGQPPSKGCSPVTNNPQLDTMICWVQQNTPLAIGGAALLYLLYRSRG